MTALARPRPIYDRPTTAAERQRRHRLKLTGGPAGRLPKEVRRALDARVSPAKARQVVATVLREYPALDEGPA